MPPHQARLLRTGLVAERTMAFALERPAGFAFEAGQSAVLTLAEPRESDGFGPSRTFTIASAPHEPELLFATRLRDTAFKRELQASGPGLRFRLEDASGVMTLHEDAKRPAVFIAGGIGVTPFLSMLRHAAQARLRHPIWLFYSNRRPEDAPFLDELRRLERSHPAFRFVPTMTQLEASRQAWNGHAGPIDRKLLERHLDDVKAPVYYLAGPPGMAIAMQSLLGSLGIADEDVRGEEFYGY